MSLELLNQPSVTSALAPGEQHVHQPLTLDFSHTSVDRGITYEVLNHRDVPPAAMLVAFSPEENNARWKRIRETHKVSGEAFHPHH